MDIKLHIEESNKTTECFFKIVMSDLKISSDKCVMIHPHVIPEQSGYLEEIIKYVVDQLNTKGWDCKIIFFHSSEGLYMSHILFYDKIVKHFMKEYSFPICNFMYVTGAARSSDALRIYHKLCTEFNLTPINLAHFSQFENYCIEDSSLLYQRKILKKFVCLNGRGRPHRLAVISEIIKRNLRDKCFLSFALKDHEIPLDYHSLSLFFSEEQTAEMQHHLDKLETLPMNLTLEEDDGNMHVPNINDIEMHKSSLFSLVNETIFFNDSKYYMDENCRTDMMCYPAPFFTEKTWKCINLKHPFILCTVPNALKALKELGYKTFHPYINESYDNIENEFDRILAIMDEVERLCEMNENQIKEWLAGVEKICEYNRRVLQAKNDEEKTGFAQQSF